MNTVDPHGTGQTAPALSKGQTATRRGEFLRSNQEKAFRVCSNSGFAGGAPPGCTLACTCNRRGSLPCPCTETLPTSPTLPLLSLGPPPPPPSFRSPKKKKKHSPQKIARTGQTHEQACCNPCRESLPEKSRARRVEGVATAPIMGSICLPRVDRQADHPSSARARATTPAQGSMDMLPPQRTRDHVRRPSVCQMKEARGGRPSTGPSIHLSVLQSVQGLGRPRP
jgi:hypothetical protein